MARRRKEDDEDIVVPTLVDDDDDDDGEIDDDDTPEVHYIQRRPSAGERDDETDDQQIPDRVLRIPLPQPWTHLRIYGWFDYPKDIADRMVAAEGETGEEAGQRVMDVLRDVIVQHDGWKDPRDRKTVLPQPSSRKFWDRIPNPLAAAIVRSYFSLVKRNPTPQVSKRKTKRR